MDTKRKMNYYDVNAIIAGVLYLYKNNYTQFSLDEYNEIATNLYDDYTPKTKISLFWRISIFRIWTRKYQKNNKTKIEF